MYASMNEFRYLYSAVIAIAGMAIAGNVALAQDKPPMEEIYITAPFTVTHKVVGRTAIGAPIEEVTITHRVSYTDLDLKKDADVATLNTRVSDAAKAGCDELVKLYPLDTTREENRTCLRTAVHEAEPQVSAAVEGARK